MKAVAVLLVVILLGVDTPNIYAQIKWNIEYQEFENRSVENMVQQVLNKQ